MPFSLKTPSLRAASASSCWRAPARCWSSIWSWRISPGPRVVKVGYAQLREAILREHPTAQIQGIYLTPSQSLWHYVAHYTVPEEGSFHASRYDAPKNSPIPLIDMAQAIAAAKAEAGEGAVSDFAFQPRDASFAYRASLWQQGDKRTFWIDAVSGRVLDRQTAQRPWPRARRASPPQPQNPRPPAAQASPGSLPAPPRSPCRRRLPRPSCPRPAPPRSTGRMMITTTSMMTTMTMMTMMMTADKAA